MEEEITKDRARLREEIVQLYTEIGALRMALHNLVEACHRADNAGELASEIEGALMSAAWKALKREY